ncbi:MAG: flagellar motor protein [Armatimonadota bacterium]
MDFATIIGLVVAFGALGASVVLEGGNLRELLSVPALIIVFGGTLGATLISVPLQDFMRLPNLLKLTFFPHAFDHADTAREIVRLAALARRNGLLQLESEVANLKDPFLTKGLSLVIDGTDSEMIRETMDTEIMTMEARHKAGAKVFNLMGGLAPTMGVIGTVMGLVNMLANVNDPATMGPAIATAFLATLYGVASANLVFLPVATKLAARSVEETQQREILMEGLMSMQGGLSPMLVEERLKSFLNPKDRNWDGKAGSAPADRSEAA